jgi:hypothetical protein
MAGKMILLFETIYAYHHLAKVYMELAKLREFRQAAYNRLCKAHDATFELTDAVLVTRNAYSLADFSLCPVFRRRWPSIYEALQECRPQRNKLMRLYIQQIPTDVRPLIAVDHTVWPRPDAVTLQDVQLSIRLPQFQEIARLPKVRASALLLGYQKSRAVGPYL